MNETCGDNRFEIIELAKQRLIDATNIESRPEEMAVLDSLLFRLWQMGWLPGQERTCTRGDEFWECSECGLPGLHSDWCYCPNCGARVVE